MVYTEEAFSSLFALASKLTMSDVSLSYSWGYHEEVWI